MDKKNVYLLSTFVDAVGGNFIFRNNEIIFIRTMLKTNDAVNFLDFIQRPLVMNELDV